MNNLRHFYKEWLENLMFKVLTNYSAMLRKYSAKLTNYSAMLSNYSAKLSNYSARLSNYSAENFSKMNFEILNSYRRYPLVHYEHFFGKIATWQPSLKENWTQDPDIVDLTKLSAIVRSCIRSTLKKNCQDDFSIFSTKSSSDIKILF